MIACHLDKQQEAAILGNPNPKRLGFDALSWRRSGLHARAWSGSRAKAHAVFASARDTRFDVELLVAWQAEHRYFCRIGQVNGGCCAVQVHDITCPQMRLKIAQCSMFGPRSEE